MKEWLKNLIGWGIFLIIAGALFTTYIYFRGIVITDTNCYKEIAEIECPNQEIDLYREFMDTEYIFKCYDYSNVDNTSRNRFDRRPDISFFSFLQSDHELCGDKYVRFKQVW